MRSSVSSVCEYLFFVAAVVVGLLTAAIFFFLVFSGLPLLVSGQLVELLFSPWAPDQGLYGIYPMLVASLILAILSMLMSFPVSLGVSFLITSLAPSRLRGYLLAMVRVMTSIPTVVYSFAALFLLVPIMRTLVGYGSGMSLLTAAPVLALVTAPTMILFFVNSFNNVSSQFTLAADAIGCTRVQKLLYIILPQAWSGILNGTLLGFGRAIGDTMVSLMLAGNSTAFPQSIAESGRTLTAHIALVMAYDFDSMEFKSIFVCGLFLYLLTAFLMFAFRLTTSMFTGKS